MVALVVEHVVSERVTKLRNVLTVMGCDLKSYWLGTLLGDMTLFFICFAVTFVAFCVCASLPMPLINTRNDDWDDDLPSFRSKPGTGKVHHVDDWRYPLATYIDDGRLIILLLLFGLILFFFFEVLDCH